MALIRPIPTSKSYKRITNTFQSASGPVTVTVPELTEIKQIFICHSATIPSNGKVSDSADVSDRANPVFTGDSNEVTSMIFKCDESNITGNTFTFYYNASYTMRYVAIGT